MSIERLVVASVVTVLCAACFVESTDDGGDQVTAAQGSDGDGTNGHGTDGQSSTSTSSAGASTDASASGPTSVADGSTTLGSEVSGSVDDSTSVSEESTAGACQTLVETFDVCPGAPWVASGAGTVQCDGHAVLTVTPAADGVLSLALPRPLTGASATVEIDAAPPPGILAMLRVRNATPQILAFRINGTGPVLEAYSDDAGNTSVLASVAYVADQHRWLRMREDTGQVVFETSADGFDFTTFHILDTAFDLGTTTIGLAANNYEVLPGDTAVAFAEFRYDCPAGP